MGREGSERGEPKKNKRARKDASNTGGAIDARPIAPFAFFLPGICDIDIELLS
jgi:hypothetical protein